MTTALWSGASHWLLQLETSSEVRLLPKSTTIVTHGVVNRTRGSGCISMSGREPVIRLADYASRQGPWHWSEGRVGNRF